MWTNMDDLRPTDRLLARGSWLISEFGGKYLRPCILGWVNRGTCGALRISMRLGLGLAVERDRDRAS